MVASMVNDYVVSYYYKTHTDEYGYDERGYDTIVISASGLMNACDIASNKIINRDDISIREYCIVELKRISNNPFYNKKIRFSCVDGVYEIGSHHIFMSLVYDLINKSLIKNKSLSYDDAVAKIESDEDLLIDHLMTKYSFDEFINMAVKVSQHDSYEENLKMWKQPKSFSVTKH